MSSEYGIPKHCFLHLKQFKKSLNCPFAEINFHLSKQLAWSYQQHAHMYTCTFFAEWSNASLVLQLALIRSKYLRRKMDLAFVARLAPLYTSYSGDCHQQV